MDEFKKYIQQHKSSLDQDVPGKGVWDAIQQKNTHIPLSVMRIPVIQWIVAACVILLAGIGSWYWAFENTTRQLPAIAKSVEKPTVLQNKTVTPNISKKGEKMTVQAGEMRSKARSYPTQKRAKPVPKNIPPANDAATLVFLQKLENSFTQVINLQKDRVSSMPMYAESADYFKDFKVQFQQIEKDEKSIKSDIAKLGLTDALLDQLIYLYRQKLGILKQLQTEMNKTNNRYRQNRGPLDSTRSYFLNL